jgi:hypothetical protein
MDLAEDIYIKTINYAEGLRYGFCLAVSKPDKKIDHFLAENKAFEDYYRLFCKPGSRTETNYNNRHDSLNKGLDKGIAIGRRVRDMCY